MKKGASIFAVILLAILLTGGRASSEELEIDLPGGAAMELVWIEPGTFMMGSPEPSGIEAEQAYREVTDSERPYHPVTISKGFYLGKYEVTQSQWEAVMGTTPWVGVVMGREIASGPNHPAVVISWYEWQDFIHRLNEAEGDSLYRMPTEAEWEYAARAGSTTPRFFGDDIDMLEDYAWFGININQGKFPIHPVGAKLPNPWGLYDIYGNVKEWTQDWYGPYTGESQSDPSGPDSGEFRVTRGGYIGFNAFMSASPRRYLDDIKPTDRALSAGLRLVRMSPVTATPIESRSWGQLKSEAQ
ncbi:MAG: formylglycine-generating enzyme family protein [Gemmatimonadetes bacterium]|jgi:formylglycine-generating enzyme required for sulfatase activity|nr:formylglycine-generating enzyme family protein [Gemmatimonadota bacterium]MBT5142739.1 formylglycine-generating enzyme family protein [Gemmatimonadota bacterium]MBT5587715.1 formylglycine-generating enzyme family protein [Gemmatimonadota bacterium]MBT5960637.1 formylglycine-generating enzyme family protein [Gemmatimonadota bacterium]MBT6630537.1 formylglycine-generating enzyme family protein [Gemmatimonadota bacterium]